MFQAKRLKNLFVIVKQLLKGFLRKLVNFQDLKKKGRDNPSFYLIGSEFQIKRNKIKSPILGWVTLKEYGYIPEESEIVSGTLKKQADKYFISFMTRNNFDDVNVNYEEYGIGIDVGIKKFSNLFKWYSYKKILIKVKKLRKIEKKIKRNARSLARKIRKIKKRKVVANLLQ